MTLVTDFKVQMEWYPPTKWCAAQAVLYTVGEVPTLLPEQDGWPPALAGMLRPLTLPTLTDEQRARKRRRWLADVCVEEPRDVDGLALHDRPGFQRFSLLSAVLAGGGCVDDVSAFGPDRYDQAVAVTYLLGVARRIPGAKATLPEHAHGAFFVGNKSLVGHYGVRRLAEDLSSGLSKMRIERGVADLAEALRVGQPSLLTYADVLPAGVGAVRGRGRALDYDSACEFAAEWLGSDLGISAERVADALNLNGFVNLSGNRNWRGDLALAAAEAHHG